jgi:hypothetical protein
MDRIKQISCHDMILKDSVPRITEARQAAFARLSVYIHQKGILG